MKRNNKRKNDQLRKVEIIKDFTKNPAGSVLITFGETRVLCSASIDEKVPPFLKDSGLGWVTAEYGMLPSSTNTRTNREATKGKQTGRTVEIQRLIGRSLRSIVDRKRIGERSILIDCDVLQADGGTRTASITGAFIALKIAIDKLIQNKTIKKNPIKEYLAAISVGIVKNEIMLDLDYNEDSCAEVDLNLIATESSNIVEIQGTAEGKTFSRKQLDLMIDSGLKGIKQLIQLQKEILEK